MLVSFLLVSGAQTTVVAERVFQEIRE